MADLESLIKYRKHNVDEKRRNLARLYEQAESMGKAKEEIERNLEKETLLALELSTAESLSDLGTYSVAMQKKISGFAKSIEEIDIRIAAAQEDMRQAFAEMKKVEITQRRRKERAASELKHKEDQELNEIGLDSYRRALDED